MVWYIIRCMDVRVRFILSMTGLGVAVVVLGVLVYISATTNPFNDEVDGPVLTPTPIDAVEGSAGSGASVGGSAADGGDTVVPEEPEVVATITLADTVVPGEEIDEDAVPVAENEAVYTVRFITSWSKRLHPDWYAEGAHFSPMFAWSHRLKNAVFERGGLASDGMEIMAETGAPPTLESELKDLRQKGFILSYGVGKVINALEEESVTITVSKTAPYASMVSMLAPSPDWFVSAHNVKLFDDGQWVERKVLPAVIYDAGTDSGTTFTARDQDTSPAEPISFFPDAPVVPIATIEFIKK